MHTLTGVLIPPGVTLLADMYGTVAENGDFAEYAAILDTAGDAVHARLQNPEEAFTFVVWKDAGFAARYVRACVL